MPPLFFTESPPRLSRVWLIVPPLLAACALLAMLGSTINMDMFRLINRVGNGQLDLLWAHATMLGDTLLAIVLLFAIGARHPGMVWAGLVTGVVASLLTHGLKELLSLPRPAAVLAADMIHIVGPTLKKYSFPSGHTTTIFALAAVVCLHLRSATLRAMAVAIAMLVGVSRIGVGAHWPADVCGGALLGWLSGIVGVMLAYQWPAGASARAQDVNAIVLVGCIAAILLRTDPIFPATVAFQYIVALGLGGVGLWGVWMKRRDARVA